MANDGLKHVVHRRVHLERSQPEHRKRKVGQYLEKKADYKKRSERYHVREKLIKELSAKTRFRNEDEFNFKMIHGKIGSEGQVILESEESARKRKLTEKGKVRSELNKIDTNMFVVNHKQNVVNKRLERMITSNVGLVSKKKSPVAVTVSGGANGGRAAKREHILYESSDSESEHATSAGATGTSTGGSATSSRTRSGGNTAKGAPGDQHEHLFELSHMFNSKKDLDALRAKLEDRRNLTVAKHKRRQVRKVRNSQARMHEYPTERLK
ncbi:uncharacterized protein TOT_010000170 [Theileria orientalis strain Shintoku]|uniref:U3 small nucleolar RNA-associated protein 11 n=1 Tax=Theileria orientalis strain Shintoku TaxID=869250 RepID=J7MC00_THEOR|nr:uncharacterized protein TOT_010000170 [Theileria orientalis strain Shintoku]BAM38702.1 uncharacterized protein TOT_010000170 [Theileria orientalis strain Shintoku]|eukprot:XP_009689003.1 uncharacterized protein TOT_010000170 [Theileria orientalis strain Shintoku]